MKIKPILNIALLTAVGTSSTVSCTWRDAGCMLGAAAAGTAAYVICENLSLSSSETAIYVGIASTLGCMLGSELAGMTEEYVALKREEYRTEAEYLQAQNELTADTIEKSNAELAWLDDQAVKMEEQIEECRKLDCDLSDIKGNFSDVSAKREQQIALVENNLNAARRDTKQAMKSASTAEEKEALKAQLQELDRSISETKKVKRKIISAGNTVKYL
ncbi:MAG: hypothetical protein E7031_10040 [Akkermansiaceae bacterium]|nr:hypothetical protein [Akkermansiaceae bacterium]